MQVRELCQRLNLSDTRGDTGKKLSREINDIVQDSRQAKEGSIFLARRGRETDGHKYIADAYRRGSRVFVVEYLPGKLKPDAVYIRVDNPAGMLGVIAAEIFDHPEDKLDIYGITGTNGKTTTSFIIQHLLEELEVKCGLIGTIRVDTGKEMIDTPRTTPEANQIFRYLNMMVEAGCRAVAMEVSSHALSLERVEGLKFRAAIFTNISRDHLDFHADFADYLGAKLSLLDYLEEKEQENNADRPGIGDKFRESDRPGENNRPDDPAEKNNRENNRAEDNEEPGENSGPGGNIRTEANLSSAGKAFYNIDDNRLRRSFQHFTGPKFSFGINGEASYRAHDISITPGRLAFELTGSRFESALTGKFNIYNCLASLTPLLAEGYRPEDLKKALAIFPGVPGRFEQVRIREGVYQLSGSRFKTEKMKSKEGAREGIRETHKDKNKEQAARELEVEAGDPNYSAGPGNRVKAKDNETAARAEQDSALRRERDSAARRQQDSAAKAANSETADNTDIKDMVDEIKVFVDYAHTPAGMENVLRSVQEFHSGRIISVFGCGGDRDKEKRPKMGQIGLKMSDLIFVTSDNPRSEKPGDIIEDILVGVKRLVNRDNYPESAYQVIADREEAIFAAVEAAEPGDIVIIFGKGHETYQEFAGRTIDFDDREVASRALASRRE